MAYSYLDAMKSDIKDYIDENRDEYDWSDYDSVYEQLNDDLWVEDSVTGNGSGSYTFDRAEARSNVQDDPEAMDYIRELISEFDEGETALEKFLDEDWEWFDVSIRCYLLGQVLSEVLDEEFGR